MRAASPSGRRGCSDTPSAVAACRAARERERRPSGRHRPRNGRNSPTPLEKKRGDGRERRCSHRHPVGVALPLLAEPIVAAIGAAAAGYLTKLRYRHPPASRFRLPKRLLSMNSRTIEPNIFSYATKELSQDAMICWLVACVHHKDSALRECGRAFVLSVPGRNGRSCPEDPRSGTEEGFEIPPCGGRRGGQNPERALEAIQEHGHLLPGEGWTARSSVS